MLETDHEDNYAQEAKEANTQQPSKTDSPLL